MQNKNKSNKKIALIIAGVVFLCLAIGAGAWYYYNQYNKSKLPTSNTDYESGESNAVNPRISPNQTDPSENKQDSSVVPKPVLVKSAGNISSVPPGVLIDFTCSAPAGYTCEIQLKSNNGEQINFDRKTISADSKGQTTVVWEWETKTGSWDVLAVLYNDNGQSNSSDIQGFEVK